MSPLEMRLAQFGDEEPIDGSVMVFHTAAEWNIFNECILVLCAMYVLLFVCASIRPSVRPFACPPDKV